MGTLNLRKISKKQGWILQYRFEQPEGGTKLRTKRFGKQENIRTIREAKRAANRWVQETQQAFDQGRGDSPTLGAFINNVWRKEHPNRGTATFERYTSTVDSQIIPLIGKKRLNQLSFRFLNQFLIDATKRYTKLTHKQLSHSGLYNYKRALSNILTFAVQTGYIEKNNMRHVSVDKIIPPANEQDKIINSSTTRNAYTQIELQTLMDDLKASPKVRQWELNFVTVMAGTGLRDQEMAALDFKHSVNWEENYLWINKAITATKEKAKLFKTTKNRVHRRVYFNETVRKALLSQYKIIQARAAKNPDYGWCMDEGAEKLFMVFAHGDGLPYRVSYLGSKLWPKLRDTSPMIPKYSLYSLRHTYATLAYHANPDAEAIAASIGDTLETFAKHYLHTMDSVQRKIGQVNFFE
ncbi:tyrosine-type recombinase/integrase [Lactiplantibacillus sp. WILCCON 0030]|uniref:Tyrosine-type recombinase/integrase n=2 Tax=Lactiplantibacillus brownii TaxID=3069269 RepID=A0ABU1A7Q4_9LACO|nr:tyrosine-type recombinase/integrase [Lactiplantibacillus brownii]MDQ7936468.1 tyrosine-type recombinase/integrase [Lactiplantibacillus brownii]